MLIFFSFFAEWTRLYFVFMCWINAIPIEGSTVIKEIICFKKLNLKAPRKNASENVVC